MCDQHLRCLQWLEKSVISQRFLNALTAVSGVEKRSPCGFFLMWGNRKNHWVSSQGCAADDPSTRRFGRSKRQWFELMCESSHCHGGQWFVFSCSFFEFLRRLLAKKLWSSIQNWLFYVAQAKQSPHDRFCRRNRRTFASKCFFQEQLLFGFGSSSKAHVVDCCFVTDSYA